MATAPFYRVDKFIVPDAARQAFIDAVDETDAVMRTQPGFVRHDLLEQVGGPGEYNFVTVAEWVQDEDAARLLQDWGCDLIQGRFVGLAAEERPWVTTEAKAVG